LATILPLKPPFFRSLLELFFAETCAIVYRSPHVADVSHKSGNVAIVLEDRGRALLPTAREGLVLFFLFGTENSLVKRSFFNLRQRRNQTN